MLEVENKILNLVIKKRYPNIKSIVMREASDKDHGILRRDGWYTDLMKYVIEVRTYGDYSNIFLRELRELIETFILDTFKYPLDLFYNVGVMIKNEGNDRPYYETIWT